MDSSLTVLFPLRSTCKCCCLSLQNISRISPLLTQPLLSIWSETPSSPPEMSAVNSLLSCILASSFASFKSALSSRPCHTASWVSSLPCSDRSPVASLRVLLTRPLQTPVPELSTAPAERRVQGSPVVSELFKGKAKLCTRFKEPRKSLKLFCCCCLCS